MRLWIDDVRPAPEGYVWLKSVNDAKMYIESIEETPCNKTRIYTIYFPYPLETDRTQIELIDIDHDAALDFVTHDTFDNVTLTVLGGDAVPCLDGVGFLEAQGRHVLTVLDFLEVNVNLVADIDLVVVHEFRGGNETLGFVADVDQCAVRTLLGNFALDDFAFGDGVGFFGGLQQVFH